MLRQPIAHDTMIFTFFSVTLDVTNGWILLLIIDSNKVATETRHTHSTIEQKKGSMDGMIKMTMPSPLVFTYGTNGSSGSLGSGFLEFLGNHGRNSCWLTWWSWEGCSVWWEKKGCYCFETEYHGEHKIGITTCL